MEIVIISIDKFLKIPHLYLRYKSENSKKVFDIFYWSSLKHLPETSDPKPNSFGFPKKKKTTSSYGKNQIRDSKNMMKQFTAMKH